MSDWFTVEQIEADTYVISEPKHWEETHSYLVCGRRAAVLIDTGLGVGDIRGVVERLTSLPVLVATTHVHWDHIGGHRLFENIAVHEAERAWLAERFPLPLSVVRQHLTCRPCEFPPGFDPAEYRIFRGEPNRILHDGDRLELGGRTLSVLHTPGHSPGTAVFMRRKGDISTRGTSSAAAVWTHFIRRPIPFCSGSPCSACVGLRFPGSCPVIIRWNSLPISSAGSMRHFPGLRGRENYATGPDLQTSGSFRSVCDCPTGFLR